MLAVAVALACCIMNAKAYDFEVDGIYYSVMSSSKSEVCVTYGDSTNCYSDIIDIPQMVTYSDVIYSVTSIGDYAFTNWNNLTK